LKKAQQIIDEISPSVNSVLLDQNNHVLLTSKGMGLQQLKPLNLVKGVDVFYEHNTVSITNNDGSINPEVYFFTESQFSFGWKLVTLQNEADFAKVIENTLIIFAIAIVLMVLFAKLLAWFISHSWSYSLHRLNQLIENGSGFNREIEFEENKNLPVEIKNLYNEIKTSRLEVVKMNQELQSTVAERTDKLQKVNSKLYVMARKDELTQLDNRRVFTEVSQSLWIDCQESLLPMSMLIIDVDHFKKINDTFGHPVGDDVLVKLAKEFEKFKVDSVNCLARLGGEEFCMLFKGGSHTEAVQLAEEIRLHIEQAVFKVGMGKDIAITVSIGLATIDPTKFTPTKLYQLADNVLYEAKNAGRNQVKAIEMN
jgi:diguanylate cyclase (GGDEF)-like protein